MGEEVLSELAALSRRYGSDPEWVLAGGGNTSRKDGSTLWVKASGASLASIGPEGFCAVDRGKLDAIWGKTYPEDPDAREAAVLADLMAAREPGETKRPSVETLLHGFFPQTYVVHTHPALANGMNCGREGASAFRELFFGEAVWIPLTDPGYVLARAVREAVGEFRSRTGRFPALMFLQNHGMLAAGDTPGEVDRISREALERLSRRLVRRPDRSPRAVPAPDLVQAAAAVARRAPEGSFLLHRADPDMLGFAESREAFAPLSAAFSPDHIVYAGHEFLYAPSPGRIDEAWTDYRNRNGQDPRIAAVAGVGAFAAAPGRPAAETAMALFLDACAIAVYAESFGGALHMTEEKIEFIRSWEVERYRAKAREGEAKK